MARCKLFSRLIFIIVISILTTNLFAQKKISNPVFDTSRTYKIELTDKSEFIGKYIARDSVSISIRTTSIPRIDIPVKTIKRINVIDSPQLVNGVYWFPNPNPTRYLFGPSAINLKKGEGYFQSIYVVVNSINYGLTDNFSIGGGIELYSLLAYSRPIFFITPKVGYKVSKNLHLGGGIMFVAVGHDEFENDGGSAGFVYGLSTFGSHDSNFTTGLGWGFIDGEFSEKPFITLSGMVRISRRAAFVSENWIIPTEGYYGVFSYGVRFFGEKISVDLAFLNNSDISEGLKIGVPFVDFVVKF